MWRSGAVRATAVVVTVSAAVASLASCGGSTGGGSASGGSASGGSTAVTTAVLSPGGSSGATPASTTSSTTTASTTTASTTTASTTTSSVPVAAGTPSGAPVTLAFAGDSNFQGLHGALAADAGGVLREIAPVLRSADLTLVNFESALGTVGRRQPKEFNFQTPATALDALRAAGVDAVSMANNHGMDFGAEGLAESLRIEQASGFPVIGVGHDEAEAYAPFTATVHGQRIAVIAANDVFDGTLKAAWTAGPRTPGIASAEEDRQDRLVAAVRSVRRTADTVAVFLHYGTELQTCPNARQRALVDLLVGAGADIVVGGHAHRVQGAGFRGPAAVAYGMGNFIFPGRSPASAETGVLVVTARGRRIDSVDWRPARIRGTVPVPLTGAAADAGRRHMDQLRACAGLAAGPPA